MELFAASAKHAAAPNRRLGPPAFRRRRHPRRAASRGPGEYADAGQARPGRECPLTRATLRHSAATGACIDFGAGRIAAPTADRAYQLGNSQRADAAAVLAFEDLHWADPTTLDLLRGIAERGALAPLF